MGLFGDASLHLLLDPSYWRPRIERLAHQPRQLVIFPRPDLERPGIEVLELRLRAHDGERLTALLARSAFAQSGESVRLRPCQEISSCQLDWRAVEAGHTDLIFRYPSLNGSRKLEDRVLDVLRVVHAACSIESVDCGKIEFPGTGSLSGNSGVDPAIVPSDDPPSGEYRANGLIHNGNGPSPEVSTNRGGRRQKGLPDEFAIAMFFRSRGWI